jgi:hypothetical protein
MVRLVERIVEMDTKNMTDTDLIKLLVPQNAVPEASQLAYKAGYYESTILSLMARFPEVRKEIEERVRMSNWNQAQ